LTTAVDPSSLRRDTWARATLTVALAGLFIGAFFLWVYPARGFTVPIGWDTARYVWRTTLVQDVGLAHMGDGLPPGANADPQRPAFVMLASGISSLTGASPFHIAAIIPAVAAAAIGLAAGAFVCGALRRPPWQLPVVAVAVGTSAFVTRLAGPETYQDNLLAAAVLMTGVLAVTLAAFDRRAMLPAMLLLGAGGVIHWAFFAVILVTLTATAMVYVPAAVRSVRSGTPVRRTIAGRVGLAAAGGAGVSAATIFGLIGASTRPPPLYLEEFQAKLRRDIGKYRFPLVLPVAMLGAVALGTSSSSDHEDARRTRLVLVLLLSWCTVSFAGFLALRVLALRVPGHRFLAFALAVPVLAILGLLWLARLPGPRRTAWAVAIVAIGVLGSAALSQSVWLRTKTWMDANKVREAATVAEYLDAAGVADGRPVILIAAPDDIHYTALMADMARAGLPATRIDDAYLYVGDPQDYVARRPTASANGRDAELSRRYFGAVAPTYRRHPVAVVTRAFNGKGFDSWIVAHPDTVVSPGVAVVRGDPLDDLIPPADVPVGRLPPAGLALLALVTAPLLWIVGLGWSVAALGRLLRRVEVAAAAPAVGIAAMVTGGVLFDTAGIRMAGVGGAMAPLLIGAAGWAVALLRHLAPWRPPGASPDVRPPAALRAGR
jgi:hypothetical protein